MGEKLYDWPYLVSTEVGSTVLEGLRDTRVEDELGREGGHVGESGNQSDAYET